MARRLSGWRALRRQSSRPSFNVGKLVLAHSAGKVRHRPRAGPRRTRSVLRTSPAVAVSVGPCHSARVSGEVLLPACSLSTKSNQDVACVASIPLRLRKSCRLRGSCSGGSASRPMTAVYLPKSLSCSVTGAISTKRPLARKKAVPPERKGWRKGGRQGRTRLARSLSLRQARTNLGRCTTAWVSWSIRHSQRAAATNSPRALGRNWRDYRD